MKTEHRMRERSTSSAPPITARRANSASSAKLDVSNDEAAKVALANRIAQILSERDLTQSAAADLLNLDQPKVSALLRGRVEGFSMGRLIRLLTILDRDIEIVIKPKAGVRRPARVQVI